MDLGEPTGSTPAWWQIFKGLAESEVEVVAIPFRGRSLDSLWWKSYENPAYWTNRLAYRFLVATGQMSIAGKEAGLGQRLVARLAQRFARPRWEQHLMDVTSQESPDCVIFVQVPLNQLQGIPTRIRDEFGIPVLYYDGDMPATLPRFGGFTVNYYLEADLSEYDGFLINSQGAVPELEALGAPEVRVLYWGVDPDVFAPMERAEDIDVFFYGAGDARREEEVRFMIAEPSRTLPEVRFVHAVSGKMGPWRWKDDGTMGRSEAHELGSFIQYREYSCRSKVNLNIARHPHVDYHASATSRPFELASMGCCVVSSPYAGMEEWFEIGEEVFMARNAEEATELYRWLLDDEEERKQAGRKARERVLEEHTHRHRAEEIREYIRSKIG